jgi:hypothetical protein
MLDPHTFGVSPAAVNLVKILEDYPHCVAKVSSRLQRFNRGLFLLACNRNNNMKHDIPFLKSLMLLYRERVIENATKLKLPADVKTHMLNVMHRAFIVWFQVIQQKGQK